MAVTKDQQKAEAPKDAKGKPKKDAPTDPDAELSEEDLELKKNLELMVQRVAEGEPGVQKAALAAICNEIQSSTSAMSAVPKPLKFLVPHVDALKAAFDAMPKAAPNRAALADVLSVLASTVAGKEGERLGLRYKLAGSLENLGQWGHEYLRHISGEVGEEFKVSGPGPGGTRPARPAADAALLQACTCTSTAQPWQLAAGAVAPAARMHACKQ
jgi:26S proteasome regulatory subunit N1